LLFLHFNVLKFNPHLLHSLRHIFSLLLYSLFVISFISCSENTSHKASTKDSIHLDSVTAKQLLEDGNKHKIKGDNIKALNSYNKAIEILEGTNQQDFSSYNARASLYFYINDLPNAREDIKRALKHAKEDSDFLMGYSNIAVTFSEKENDSSILYLNKAAAYCPDNQQKEFCFVVYNNLASLYLNKGQNKLALETFTNNVTITELDTTAPRRIYQGALITLGEIHLNLKQHTESISYLNNSLEYLSTSNNDLNFVIRAKELLAKNYEQKGNLKLCIETLKDIDILKKQSNDIAIKKEIARIENNKIIEVKQTEINNLSEVVSKTKLISYIIISLLVLTLAVFLYRVYKNKVRILKLNESLSLNRLKSLRSLMNPHFLFNSFSTLQNFILKKEHIKANEHMTELSVLIREVLSSTDSIYHSFTKEIQILESYIALEKNRFNNTFDCEFDIEDSLLELNPMIPSMMIQPYLENAIIHGFSKHDNKGKLTIAFKNIEDTLFCKVVDNGVGRDQAEKNKSDISVNSRHLSTATRNINERLRILNTINKSNSKIHIKDLFSDDGKPSGTQVQIQLTLKKP